MAERELRGHCTMFGRGICSAYSVGVRMLGLYIGSG